MAIQNFPTKLQPIVQQGFLASEFEDGLTSRLGFRAIADRETFPTRIGESITKTRKGLKSPVTSPMVPAANTNFDNGLSPSSWSVGQYVLSINQYGDTIDLNMVTEGVGIASQFLANARTNGVQAMQSLDRLARNALFGGTPGGLGEVAIGDPAEAAEALFGLWQGASNYQVSLGVEAADPVEVVAERVERGIALFMRACGRVTR